LNDVDNARQATKPAMPMREIGDSAPPATMTSASRARSGGRASPMACAPVEHAVTTAWFGPFRPCVIDTYPDARLISRPGMKNGDNRRGPVTYEDQISRPES